MKSMVDPSEIFSNTVARLSITSEGTEPSQVGDVVVDDGGVADGQARDVFVAQELVTQDARLPAGDIAR